MTASDLPSTTKLVLFVIAEYASSIDDTCWPSIDQIAERATLSPRAVTKHLDVAETEGWIRRWKSRKNGRKWAHGHYRLTVPEVVARRARDDLSYDIAGAQANESERRSCNSGEFDEPRSEDAQEIGNLEPRSGNSGELVEPGSRDAQELGSSTSDLESYRNHVPTNYPMNRNNEALSLSQTSSVYQGGEGTGREGDRQEGVETLAAWMARRLRDSDPGAGEPDHRKWASDVDELLADGFEPQQIVKLWAWALQDGFWKSVIRSPARLRKNWDQVRAKRNQSSKREWQPSPIQAQDDRRCAHVGEDGERCVNAATSILGAGSARRGYCRLHVGLYEN
ncbi:helix-turn-helix domain-containing protein [Burkholderia cepacia]|uniref:helix-turn-helix domain-containing protein n=1 Tax=Burkholderia cepacia TaxID=292 RepID=UPI00249E5264|nr:helix-turn-helix domain-containing protein [Burkholderia cepacia]WGY71940.1 helix-turn-helix domain-containing protein [Burkholderia cepacia]